MTNRLASESSPYLRQHADNPVDWWPWGTEAFDEARRRGVPVLLSVGYSACHWCHVMAHESFEDPAAAAVMNDLFVNVKVDREERPDVDAVYMEAVQALTGHGGWPMTVWLNADGEPFFGGTYFPSEPRHGMHSFLDVCRAVAGAYRDKPDDIADQAARLREVTGRLAALEPSGDRLGPDSLAPAAERLSAQFDEEWGGFGRAPKFPQAMSLDLLLRHHVHTGDARSLEIVTTSLDAMASGGMYDHLGGGFARYSVDREWLVPHFEKMLYDQALLARAYLHAWQVTGAAHYRQVLEETIAYVLRDLRHRDGGFFSAEDADSEGVEGRFYVWTPDQVAEALGDDALTDAAIAWYGITEAGNFEGDNILHRPVRGDLERSPEVERARARLFDVREQRVRPGLDDKVLVEWNALFLAVLAEAGAATGTTAWVEAAVAAGDFLLDRLRDDEGRWLRSWQEQGGARHRAVAADLAAATDAFVRLAEATGRSRWIDAARATADELLAHHLDQQRGGFFSTADDVDDLVVRPKDLMDNATPSAGSSAAMALTRLHALTGEVRYRQAAEAALDLVAAMALDHPGSFALALSAADVLGRPAEIVVVGDRPDLVEVVHHHHLPTAVLAWGEPYDSPLWEGREAGLAYVCSGHACQAPTDDPAALGSQLAALG